MHSPPRGGENVVISTLFSCGLAVRTSRGRGAKKAPKMKKKKKRAVFMAV